jgi:predicted nucleic acid-binding Zn ribbon protein
VKPISELIRKVIKTGEAEHLGEIEEAWPGIAGEKAAAHCKPLFLVKGRLTVVCDSSAWLFELNGKRREILNGLRQTLGQDLVKGVYFRQGEGDGNGENKDPHRGR